MLIREVALINFDINSSRIPWNSNWKLVVSLHGFIHPLYNWCHSNLGCWCSILSNVSISYVPWKTGNLFLNILSQLFFWSMNHTMTLFTYFHSLSVEKAMAPHSSILAWKLPWTEEPGSLQSMGSQGVGQDWATSLSLFTFMHWRRKWQPTPVFLPGESKGRGSLVGCRPWGRTESDTTEVT